MVTKYCEPLFQRNAYKCIYWNQNVPYATGEKRDVETFFFFGKTLSPSSG